jgi:hypothetical protein
MVLTNKSILSDWQYFLIFPLCLIVSGLYLIIITLLPPIPLTISFNLAHSQISSTGNNFILINDNLEAIDFKISERNYFVMNEYSRNRIDEDDFYREVKYFIKFNYSWLYYHNVEHFNHYT